MTSSSLSARNLLAWAIASLSSIAPVPDDLNVDVADATTGGLLDVTVSTGGVATGFGLDPSLPSRALLDTFVYFLADALIEARHGAWPPCPEHGDAHPADIRWLVEDEELGCRLECPSDPATG